ncbi:hypothetical protein ACW9HQ_53000, partial [Nocardia gipuzkoensis]
DPSTTYDPSTDTTTTNQSGFGLTLRVWVKIGGLQPFLCGIFCTPPTQNPCPPLSLPTLPPDPNSTDPQAQNPAPCIGPDTTLPSALPLPTYIPQPTSYPPTTTPAPTTTPTTTTTTAPTTTPTPPTVGSTTITTVAPSTTTPTTTTTVPPTTTTTVPPTTTTTPPPTTTVA